MHMVENANIQKPDNNISVKFSDKDVTLSIFVKASYSVVHMMKDAFTKFLEDLTYCYQTIRLKK